MAVQVQRPPTHSAALLSPRAGTSGPRWLVPGLVTAGLVALLGCLLLGGSLTTAVVPGLPDAGPGTRWGLPVASMIAESAAVLALGAAVLVTALIPVPRSSAAPIGGMGDGDPAIRARCLRTAGCFSGLAAAASLVVFVLTVSDLTARPLPAAVTVRAAIDVATFGPGLLLLICTVLSTFGAVLSLLAARRLIGGAAGQQRVLAVLVTGLLAGGLVPWALGGHTAQSGQDIAASSLIVHVLAAGCWIGGLTMIVLGIRGELLTRVLPRFSVLALWCWVAIGVSGVITGWLRVGQVADLWTSGYGRLLLLKLLCLGILGGFGVWHRRRISVGLAAMKIGQRGALLRVAAVEVLVMGATMGVATALSATAPPIGHATGHDAAHGTSRIEALAGHQVPVISAENLAVLWRPDVLVLLLVAVALTCYLAGVRRLRLAGTTWPVARVCWAIAAAVATVLVLNSGMATYDGLVWSVTVTQQGITSMIIPVAIVLARPWALATRRGPARRIVGGLTARPWMTLIAYAAWTTAGLLTPVALWSVSNHAVLMVARVGDIVVGSVFFMALLGTSRKNDSAARRPPPTALVLAWFAVQIGVGGALLLGGTMATRQWFTQLNLAWITVAQDERTAAFVHLGIAISVLLLTAMLLPPTVARTARAHGRPPSFDHCEDSPSERRDRPIVDATRSESRSSRISVTSERRHQLD